MNVLLIHPPDSKYSIAPGRFEPLALETLAATIPGHDVEIIDLRLDKTEALQKYISISKPFLIGVTTNNTIHVNKSLKILQLVKKMAPWSRVVVGGHHPTMVPEDFRKPFIDAIFYGWAERSFPEYIDAISNGQGYDYIEGIEILKNGKTIFKSENNWDLKPSEIPYPRRDLVEKYHGKYISDTGYKTSLVNTTRGCPNRCSFCAVWKATKGHFLMRKPEDVFNEIIRLPKDITRVFFADDNTFINPKNADKLARMLNESGIKKKYSGYCRSDTIVKHPEIMEHWKKIGLSNLCVGFEMSDNNHLSEINKKNNIANNEEAARILNKIDIPFRPHFLIKPSFEKKDFEKLLAYVRAHNLKSPIFPILTPIPGSDDYEELKDAIWLKYDYFDYSHAVTPTRLSPKEFYWSWIKLFQRSYPIGKNVSRSMKRSFARATGNTMMEERNRHVPLFILLKLKIFALYVILKLIRHYRRELLIERFGD